MGKNMFFGIPEMPSKTFVMAQKKLPDHFNAMILRTGCASIQCTPYFSQFFPRKLCSLDVNKCIEMIKKNAIQYNHGKIQILHQREILLRNHLIDAQMPRNDLRCWWPRAERASRGSWTRCRCSPRAPPRRAASRTQTSAHVQALCHGSPGGRLVSQ